MLDVREVAPDRLCVVGTVDLISGAQLRVRLHEAVERALAAGQPVLEVDLSNATFADASGLGILLGAHRRARRGGLRLRLMRPSPEFSRVLLVSRLYRVLDVRGAEDVDLSGGPTVDGDLVPRPRVLTDDDAQLTSS
jgi:anti-anti-sigma factor